MRKGNAILSLLAFALALVGCSMTAEEACACVKRMPEAEFAALRKQAEAGDVRATGDVWMEFWIRNDTGGMQQWRSRVIASGAATALWKMSSGAWSEIHDARSPESRHALIAEASMLIELANSNRSQIEDNRWTNDEGFSDEFGSSPISFDTQADFARDVREIRALVAVDRLGLEHWLRLANAGDPIAAFHVHTWYSVLPNQIEKELYWMDQASRLGDPTYAGLRAGGISEESQHDIEKALGSQATFARAGDPWMQERFRRELIARYRSFAIRYNNEHRDKPLPTAPKVG